MITWHPVIGFEGFYEVSNIGGFVRSLDRTITTSKGAQQLRKGGTLAAQLAGGSEGKRYFHVCLHRDGKRIGRFVHQLVAAAFHGLCPAGHDVHHKDGNQQNNDATNLEYKEKASHLRDHVAGENNFFAILSAEDVIWVRQQLAAGVTVKKLAGQLGVCNNTIGRIKNGKSWAHLGDPTVQQWICEGSPVFEISADALNAAQLANVYDLVNAR